jgi:hypothetical protein
LSAGRIDSDPSLLPMSVSLSNWVSAANFPAHRALPEQKQTEAE